MKENVLKFKNDIKALVAKQKETGYSEAWMHPIYCAYYILKHNISDIDAYIEGKLPTTERYYKNIWSRAFCE